MGPAANTICSIVAGIYEQVGDLVLKKPAVS